MIQKTNNILVLFLLFSTFLSAQINQYNYKRELHPVSEKWHSIPLPNTIFEKTRNDLSDIRIYGVSEKDTTEAPYALNIKNNNIKNVFVDFKALNTSHNSNGYYYTYEITNKEIINEIALNFDASNFEYAITLEASQNQTEWFTLKENYRILSIKNEYTNYSFTTLKFDDSSYKYYRVHIKTKEDPKLKSARIYKNKETSADYISHQIKNIESNFSNKVTTIIVDLENAVPVSYIQLAIDTTNDYYRPVQVTYANDSVQTEKGWKYNYKILDSGVLSSLESNEFRFNSRKTKKLKITINQQDNQPIEVSDISVKGFQYELLARFTKPATYYLVYGNNLSRKPNYDITSIPSSIPKNSPSLSLREEKQIVKSDVKQTKPLFENKKWLWGIMLVIIAVITWFTIGMIKKS